MALEPKPKRVRGRPPLYPDYERVIELAIPYVAQGYTPHMAVRKAIDVHSSFDDISSDGTALVPAATTLIRKTSDLAEDGKRYKAARAKWDREGKDDLPPWPEATLSNSDTVVEQIARKLRKRLKTKASG